MKNNIDKNDLIKVISHLKKKDPILTSNKEVRKFDLPFITEVVFAEVISNLSKDMDIERVPFFQNCDGMSEFSYIS